MVIIYFEYYYINIPTVTISNEQIEHGVVSSAMKGRDNKTSFSELIKSHTASEQ